MQHPAANTEGLKLPLICCQICSFLSLLSLVSEVEEGPAFPDVVGDNDGAAARSMTEVEDETVEM